MDVQFAVAKISKYASSESGDTLEMVERPHGGISFVLADGQGDPNRPARNRGQNSFGWAHARLSGSTGGYRAIPGGAGHP